MKIENVDIRINDIDHIWYNNKQYISLNRVNQMLRDKRTETQGITDEQAIEHLQSTGWMQNHDREMYESGFRECLSGDGGSYDSLIPETHDKHTETHPCDYGKKETHGDVIYRQDAIDAISCDITVTGKQNAELVAATIGSFADRIKALSSAESDSCEGCEWECAFGYGECHHCKRNFDDMYEVKEG